MANNQYLKTMLVLICTLLASCTNDETLLINIKSLPNNNSKISASVLMVQKDRLDTIFNKRIVDSMYVLLRMYDSYPIYSQLLFLKQEYRNCKIYIIDSIVDNSIFVYDTESKSGMLRIGHFDGRPVFKGKILKANYLIITDSTDERSKIITATYETINATKLIPEKYYNFEFNSK